jgi:alkylation response protein AidB-like acyl-CoA dehydrogenase
LPFITKEGAGGPPQPGFTGGWLGRNQDPLFVLRDPNHPSFDMPELGLGSDMNQPRLTQRRSLSASLTSPGQSRSLQDMDDFQARAFIGGGCVLVEDGEPLKNSAGFPRNHMLFFPADQVRSLDTWHVSGLSGTGSTAFEVKDLFVPERHAAGVLVKTLPDRPLYRFPAFSPLAQGIGAVALGIARAALDEAIRVAGEKRRGGAAAPLAERPHTQIEIARAEARLRAARALFYQTIDAAWDAAQSPAPVPLDLSRDMRLAVNHAVSESAAVVDAMYTLAGGTSVYATSPLQRHFRDIHVATQHFMVSPNILETAGRLYLGLTANTAGF